MAVAVATAAVVIPIYELSEVGPPIAGHVEVEVVEARLVIEVFVEPHDVELPEEAEEAEEAEE